MSIKVSDEKFFTELLDYEKIGAAALNRAAEKKDFSLCRKLFANYIRETIDKEKYFSALSGRKEPKESDDVVLLAENACRHYMVSCGIPCDFGENEVQWESNPTPTGYREWTYQVNRHQEFENLARAYQITGNKKYADSCEELFKSWIKQIDCPPSPTAPGDTKAWRTIEAGIRMGLKWPEVFHTFYKEFSDDAVVDWCKSVYEHGQRLRNDHSNPGNWLIMEMNGLMHIGVLNPWLCDAKAWQEYAMKVLEENLYLQVYPDGVHYELTTDYQFVVIKNYAAPIKLFTTYGIDFPEKMRETLKKLIMFYIEIMRPDGKVPSINDGTRFDTAKLVETYKDLFESDENFEWVTGCCDKEPSFKSIVHEYPGFATFRSGWGKDDTYVFFDGGEFGKAHQHEDKLQVVLFADGKEILVDPGNYAYDRLDPVRHHICWTQAHNCVRVDGKDQNRGDLYKWTPDKLDKKSGIIYNLTDSVDAVRGVYDEGYGAHGISCENLAKQERSIYFVKKAGDLRPFVIVADRLTSDKERSYEVMWHIDADNISARGLNVKGDSLHIVVPEYEKDTAGIQISYGVKHLHEESVHLQGWTADSAIKNDYRPIYTASHMLRAKDIRHITVIYPDAGKDLYIKGVEASQDVSDTTLTLILSDGTRLDFDEKNYL